MKGIFWKQLPGITLSNDDLTATSLNHNYAAVATIGRSSGKWYWEVVLSDNLAMIGVTSVTTGVKVWNTVNHRGYFSDGKKWSGASGVAYANTFIIGDTISILMDLDNGTLEFWKNGVSQGVAFNDLKSLGMIYPTHGSGAASTASTVTANFGKKTFRYKMPSGYERYQGYENKILLSSGGKYFTLSRKYTTSLIPIMTTNTTPSGVASASDETAVPAFRAFDGASISQRYWAPNGKTYGWVAYDFKTPTLVARYDLMVILSNPTFGPKSWTFEGSNDGVNWTVLDTQNNQSTWINDKPNIYDLNKIGFYQKYRLNITSNNGAVSVGIGELRMYGIRHLSMSFFHNISELTYVNHGMNEVGNLTFNVGEIKEYTNISITLGTGKIFEHTIDMSMRQIDKIAFG